MCQLQGAAAIRRHTDDFELRLQQAAQHVEYELMIVRQQDAAPPIGVNAIGHGQIAIRLLRH